MACVCTQTNASSALSHDPPPWRLPRWQLAWPYNLYFFVSSFSRESRFLSSKDNSCSRINYAAPPYNRIYEVTRRVSTTTTLRSRSCMTWPIRLGQRLISMFHSPGPTRLRSSISVAARARCAAPLRNVVTRSQELIPRPRCWPWPGANLMRKPWIGSSAQHRATGPRRDLT